MTITIFIFFILFLILLSKYIDSSKDFVTIMRFEYIHNAKGTLYYYTRSDESKGSFFRRGEPKYKAGDCIDLNKE